MDDRDEQARRARIEHHATWVELELRQAIARGDFDDLPSAGKPIPDLGVDHDPDWWLKRLVERERISVLPPALALRTEDARLEETLDALGSAEQVVETLEDFNARIVEARRQLAGGPPVITPLRDVDAELERWRERRRARVAARSAAAAEAEAATPRRRRWFRRRR